MGSVGEVSVNFPECLSDAGSRYGISKREHGESVDMPA